MTIAEAEIMITIFSTDNTTYIKDIEFCSVVVGRTRKRKFEIETTEDIKVALATPEDMLKLE
jgi:hypothetical protein